ncbi:MAG TPA: hypothetical protein VK698_00440 [Kofleriaceae bacterium]|nr:hypothetical protein [Kofleriaceae bacterium]
MGFHGAPYEALLVCETDDDGELIVPADLIARFPRQRSSSLQHPSWLARFSRDVIDTDESPSSSSSRVASLSASIATDRAVAVHYVRRVKRRLIGLALALSACSTAEPAASATIAPAAIAPEARPAATASWAIPDGFRSEMIPFPLEFAPGLDHRGVEELRFAPGFFDPAAPGYWSYAFVWRLEDAAALDAAGLARELEVYFQGLLGAVDREAVQASRTPIAVTARPAGVGLVITAHLIDAFKTKQPVTLTGTAERRACPSGAVWIFALAPERSGVRDRLAALASEAACGQAPVPNRPR